MKNIKFVLYCCYFVGFWHLEFHSFHQLNARGGPYPHWYVQWQCAHKHSTETNSYNYCARLKHFFHSIHSCSFYTYILRFAAMLLLVSSSSKILNYFIVGIQMVFMHIDIIVDNLIYMHRLNCIPCSLSFPMFPLSLFLIHLYRSTITKTLTI